jgi:hypothetical protein
VRYELGIYIPEYGILHHQLQTDQYYGADFSFLWTHTPLLFTTELAFWFGKLQFMSENTAYPLQETDD